MLALLAVPRAPPQKGSSSMRFSRAAAVTFAVVPAALAKLRAEACPRPQVTINDESCRHGRGKFLGCGTGAQRVAGLRRLGAHSCPGGIEQRRSLERAVAGTDGPFHCAAMCYHRRRSISARLTCWALSG